MNTRKEFIIHRFYSKCIRLVMYKNKSVKKKEMEWLVIGISGATNSGKTTISKKLHESIKDSILINQDSYFLLKDDPRHTLVPELNHFNWEILSSLDMEKMYSDLIEILQPTITTNSEKRNCKKRLLIIEGFLLYNCKPIADLCDKKYFLEISRDVCWERRKVRIYDPADVPGYFDKVVWPEYIKHKSEIESDKKLCESITFLDGTKNLDELCNDVLNEVTMLLK